MFKNSLLTGFFFLFALACLGAEVFPGEGAALNYRMIGFSFPVKNDRDSAVVQIALGRYSSIDSFSKNIISTTSCTGGRAIIEAPAFGAQYTWRFVTGGKGAARHTGGASSLYHFSTGWISEMDTLSRRLRVIKNTGQYSGDYVFVDGMRMLFDMSGQPVWYLPGASSQSSRLMDMKLTPFGTITFMLGARAYEVDYAGNVLWKGPDKGIVSGDSASEYYHHEFTRLANGHYMVLGRDKPGSGAPPGATTPLDPSRLNYGNIMEYDENGTVVWSWKSHGYIDHSDIDAYTDSAGARLPEAHENSFFFDEATRMLYVGFRNVSRIVTIDYPQGDVVDAYGEKFRKGVAVKNDGLFCKQHACTITHDGSLCIYNNNDCHWPSPPEVVIARQPQQPGGGLEKVWEFPCDVEGMDLATDGAATQRGERNTSGGNVIELPDGNIFVSMNTPYGNIFIVTRDKKAVWNAISEQGGKNGWRPFAHYRASMVANPKDMERLVWNRPGGATDLVNIAADAIK